MDAQPISRALLDRRVSGHRVPPAATLGSLLAGSPGDGSPPPAHRATLLVFLRHFG